MPKTGDVVLISEQERDLLCALSYAHLACGQSAQSLALLRLAVSDNSQDVSLLRIFAYALIAEGLGDEALTILDRLDVLDDQQSSRVPLTLMRSHALLRARRMDEARAVFQSYVSLRSSTVLLKQT
ncbi:histidine kinase [Mesorhizobium abyssinicae]|uniref:Histidine kinase n=3 Tax=Mesorhizobium TaxID=68287 RepID=A0ABU4YVG7_9HYPH|nr:MULTISPECIES: histidine kinase [Mesorhizobium]MDX8437811.1 histidine kinase [Mesorhizobium abyssinicae]MDX8457083.1 histidine kinase [Mesorhizobium sp. VK9D]MDX8463532.1 histidine kinase [Mesorhizobium sp. VK2D]MDX8489802.1 histidine kinase [Mesorhizobium sp. VK2B]MDX8522758.1 histidine kinase [Mesorhizobium sp. VK23D]